MKVVEFGEELEYDSGTVERGLNWKSMADKDGLAFEMGGYSLELQCLMFRHGVKSSKELPRGDRLGLANKVVQDYERKLGHPFWGGETLALYEPLFWIDRHLGSGVLADLINRGKIKCFGGEAVTGKTMRVYGTEKRETIPQAFRRFEEEEQRMDRVNKTIVIISILGLRPSSDNEIKIV
jgi:hypothetical protein